MPRLKPAQAIQAPALQAPRRGDFNPTEIRSGLN
jgi:hypothetical protein